MDRFQQENEDMALQRALQLSLEKQRDNGRSRDHNNHEQRLQQEKDDEDLARALQLSLEMSEEDVRRQDRNYQGQAFRAEEEIQMMNTSKTVTTSLKRMGYKEPDNPGQGPLAMPLCLPNNYEWDPQTRKCKKTAPKRSSLYVIKEALDALRKIKGPVCVVSVAGTYRKGKSFVLAEAFDQPEIFPLGHEMVPETIGIWYWIVPEKHQDSNGREITVVLLDSEGIDSAQSEGFDDHQIFTLVVLLASVLIFNSQSVPTRNDLEKLDFIVKLSQRIRTRSEPGTAHGEKDIEFYHKTFPHFIWLLRDVMLSLPSGCKDLKDFFLKEVFNEEAYAVTGQAKNQVAESILRLFPGFDAFMLPPPSCKPEDLRRINQDRSKLNSDFLSGLEDFKRLLKTTLAPKTSINDGEFVTGEGLAALVEIYIEAINTPGVIPDVESAWESVVKQICSDAIEAARKTYQALLSSQLSNKLPCDNDLIRLSHNAAFGECEGVFMADVAGFATETVEKHMRELKVSMEEKLNYWHTENERLTRQLCKDLLRQLKTQQLDPVFQRLQAKGGAQMSFEDITGAYLRIKEIYEKEAKGAKNVITSVFFDFHPDLKREKEQYMARLEQLQDFDAEQAKILAARALQDQEREKLREREARLEQENKDLQNGMEMLKQNRDEEKERIREQIQKEAKAETDQIRNMCAAKMNEARKQRKEFAKKNKKLQDRLHERQKHERENMEKIKKITEQLEKIRQDRKRVEEPGFLNQVLRFGAVALPLIGGAVSLAVPPLAPIALAVGIGTGAAAEYFSDDSNCAIM